MRNRSIIFITFIFVGLLASCFDLYDTKEIIAGPYFVSSDPAAVYKTLYYDVGNGSGIERVRNIKRAGHTDKFIIVEVQEGYYFIDRLKDDKYLNANEIIRNLKTHEFYLNWLDSMNIDNFEFDYSIKK